MGHKIQHSFVSPVGESIVFQLRTGYVGLNEYLHKCNIKETDLCKCGAKETLSHFLLECQELDMTRELMRKQIFDTCSITHLENQVGSESPCRAELPSADLHSLIFQIHPR